MNRIFFLVLVGLGLLGAGCAKSGSSGSSSDSTSTTCATGYVYSSTYGCLAQSTCPTGYGLYNNQCVYLTTTTTTLTCPTGYIQSGTTCVVNTATTYSACQGSCPVGYTQTAYGCFPQGNCMSCYGAYGQYCMGGSQVGYTWYWKYY